MSEGNRLCFFLFCYTAKEPINELSVALICNHGLYIFSNKSHFII